MEYVDVARADSERGEVVLRERRATPDSQPVLELRVNGVFVMDTEETSTERALATTALACVPEPRDVLVAGLGLGFTAHEVLADHRVQRLVVVEVEESLVAWMRDGTVPHGPALLADGRFGMVTADIRVGVAEAAPASYDLVLLDVDNGPGFLVHETNAELYRAGFLGDLAALLRPGGAVVVWASSESPPLADALRGVFGSVAASALDVRLQDRDEQYWLYLAPDRSGADAPSPAPGGRPGG